MQFKRIIVSVFCVISFQLIGLKAQTSINVSGGNAHSIVGASVSYSVGQVFNTSSSGVNGIIIQGVQQPYEISELTEIKWSIDSCVLVFVYPNPTSDKLILKVNSFDFMNLYFQLYNMHGGILKNEIITKNETIIDLKYLSPATYFLKVYQLNNEIKTFKIIKK